MENTQTIATGPPAALISPEQEIMIQLKKLLENGSEEMIGSIEYMIKKVTTHPDQMSEADYLAAVAGMNIVSFIKLCSLYKIKP